MMKIIAQYPVPFAVTGGGHAMQPRFSSTTGIHISMSRFSDVEYNPVTKLVKIGAGCLWDQVYKYLAPTKMNVIGGASHDGVGVAGFLLGGGWSLKSNRYGLGIDNIYSITVVTPDGSIRTVSASVEPQLFNALRGGGNNFGIVTSFVLKTYEQNNSWGGYFSVKGDQTENTKKALAAFVAEEKRPEAALLVAFNHLVVDGQVENTISILCVYDAPKPTDGEELPYKQFADVLKGQVWKDDPARWQLGKIKPLAELQLFIQPSLPGNGSKHEHVFTDIFEEIPAARWMGAEKPPAFHTASYTGHADNTIDSNDGDDDEEEEEEEEEKEDKEDKRGNVFYTTADEIDSMGEKSERGRFGCLMITRFTKPLLDKITEEVAKAAEYLKTRNGVSVTIDAWPAHTDIFKKSPPGAAYPHKPYEPFGPMLVYFRWKKADDDDFWFKQIKNTLIRIRKVARSEGVLPQQPSYYSNLSLETVSVRDIYCENLPWLQKVKAQYDPHDVMGRAGGRKIRPK